MRLEAEGYVRSLSGGQHVSFDATARLIVLGAAVARRLDVADMTRAKISAEGPPGVLSWYVSFPDRAGLWISDDSPPASSRGARTNTPHQRRETLHALADGKVLLSSDSELLSEVMNQQLIAYTNTTLTARADLLLELAGVRRRNIAVESGEFDPSVVAVASGITDHTGKVVAVVGAILEPTADGTHLAQGVRDLAEQVSLELGGAPTHAG